MNEQVTDAYNKHQGGLASFYRDVIRPSGLKLTKVEVEQILLRNNPNYYLYAQPTRVRRRNPVIAHNVGQISIDLADFSRHKSNQKHSYIFCAVDQFSRYCFLVAKHRKNSESCLDFVQKVMVHWRSNFDIRVTSFGSDYEAGLRSSLVQDYITSTAAGYFFESQSGTTHNSTAEATIRLVTERLQKCLTRDGVDKWSVKHVQQVQDQLNSRKPRSLGSFTPLEVMSQRRGARHTVRQRQMEKYRKRKLEQRTWPVGTRVRIRPFSGTGSYARKGRLAKWTTNTTHFEIHKVLKRPVPCYKLVQVMNDGTKEHLSSIFYNDEILPIDLPRSINTHSVAKQ